MSFLRWWMVYLSFLLRYCPAPLVVVWFAAHIAFWSAISLYGDMALNQFDAWLRLTWASFLCMVAMYVPVTLAAVIVWRRR